MRIPATYEIRQYPAVSTLPAQQPVADRIEPLYSELLDELGLSVQAAQQAQAARKWKVILSARWWKVILFPSLKYPENQRAADETYFRTEWGKDIKGLSDGHAQNSCSPTLLASSQRVYDAEITRRESINTRCTTVLGTAGILGALVVAAGQLGLIQQRGSFSLVALIIYIPFFLSLVYLGFSIAVALKVQGEMQGNVVGPADLSRGQPRLGLNKYNINMAETNLLYAMANWYLNNNFKYRLNSAQRYLRNGIIAIIVAGVLSPWPLTIAA